MKTTASDIKVNDFLWLASSSESIAVTHVIDAGSMVIVRGLASVSDMLTGQRRTGYYMADDQVRVTRGAGRVS
jgi:hypothetical protein